MRHKRYAWGVGAYLVLVRKGEPRAERGLSADDAVAPKEVGLRAIHMHGPPLPLGRPRVLSHELGEDVLDAVAARVLVGVVAV